MRFQTAKLIGATITTILLAGIAVLAWETFAVPRPGYYPNQTKLPGNASDHSYGPTLPENASGIAATVSNDPIPFRDEYATTELNNERAAAIVLSNTMVDTNGWKTFSDPRYGYEFKYPPNWTIEIRSPGYVDDEAVAVVNRSETRVLEDTGPTYYEISVEKVRYNVPALLQATSSAEKAKILQSGLPASDFLIASLSHFAGNAILIYNIRNNPNDAVVLVTTPTRAYEILFIGYFVGDPSKEDAEAFRGIYSSFKLLKQ